MPYVYLRRAIAERWGIPPPLVDEFPATEIALEMRILELEADRKDGG